MATPSKRQQRALRSHQLRMRGLTWEHIAAVWETDHPDMSPREAFRTAHDLSLQDVADRWNQLDAGDAPMVRSRILEFERWPKRGRRPSVTGLHVLARIYQTHARSLLTNTEYALYKGDERAEIDRIDYRSLDENYRTHEPIEIPETPYPGTPEVSHPSLTDLRDRRILDPAQQLSLYARESSKILTQAEQSNVGDDTIARLQAELQQAAHNYLKIPMGKLLADVRRIRDEALHLLEGRQPLRYRTELHVIASWAMTVLGWASTDLGRVDATAAHTHTAWYFAQEAGSDVLRAWVCKTRQVAAYWANNREAAIQHAERGAFFAARVGGQTHVMLASTLALDYARAGRLHDARETLAQARDIPAEQERQCLGGVLSCPPERALSYWADAALVLGQPALALELAESGVAASRARSAPDRNLGTERMTQLHVVRAHIDQDELEAAEHALATVLDTPLDARPAPLLLQLSEIPTRMGPSLRDSRDGRRISDAIGAFRAATTSRPERRALDDGRHQDS
ncbi:hypothetical protein [Nonomuraea sp. NPDC050202]|uniref:hypothetical protein n=1 Tax=Nonomuraea sp. NPDC050202 TaxID=3155035 RepID=UPI00340E3759